MLNKFAVELIYFRLGKLGKAMLITSNYVSSANKKYYISPNEFRWELLQYKFSNQFPNSLNRATDGIVCETEISLCFIKHNNFSIKFAEFLDNIIRFYFEINNEELKIIAEIVP